MYFLDENNLYGWKMSQKLPVSSFKWVEEISKFDEHFIKDYDENSHAIYFLEVDVEYQKKINLHSHLPFLPKRNKIKKYNQLACNMHDKENHVVHIRALKQVSIHGSLF